MNIRRDDNTEIYYNEATVDQFITKLQQINRSDVDCEISISALLQGNKGIFIPGNVIILNAGHKLLERNCRETLIGDLQTPNSNLNAFMARLWLYNTRAHQHRTDILKHLDHLAIDAYIKSEQESSEGQMGVIVNLSKDLEQQQKAYLLKPLSEQRAPLIFTKFYRSHPQLQVPSLIIGLMHPSIGTLDYDMSTATQIQFNASGVVVDATVRALQLITYQLQEQNN